MVWFHPVNGFLGAGKTTTLLAAARTLRERGHRPAIITNDQGTDLVDTVLARTATDRVAEVTGGCFCCRFEDLAAAVTSLVEAGADVVLAESVGSCTDLRATVVRPLRREYGDKLRVGPLTAVVDPDRYRLFARAWDLAADSDLAYLYHHQLAEADVIAVNKIDTVAPALLTAVTADLAVRFPMATVVTYSARSGDVDALLDFAEQPDRSTDAELDYDRYAAAEAELAWLNLAVTVTRPGGFQPAAWARTLLETFSLACAESDSTVGHAKLSMADSAGLTKASLTAAGGPVRLDVVQPDAVTSSRAMVNVRVAMPPADLDQAVAAAIAAADTSCDTVSAAEHNRAFRPSYPRPTHRMPAG
ncbi:GTP-binding protein [Actinocrispum wychmicini]|nr:GTP-binding protein [Actinocrispum wychmicini]